MAVGSQAGGYRLAYYIVTTSSLPRHYLVTTSLLLRYYIATTSLLPRGVWLPGGFWVAWAWLLTSTIAQPRNSRAGLFLPIGLNDYGPGALTRPGPVKGRNYGITG